jgi:hypothetical protein
MKKIAIVLFVAATALAACGKKKAPANPEPTAGDTGSAAPAEGGSASDNAGGSAGGSGK